MGRRTYFYENIAGKSCKDLLAENYSTFRQWFLEEYAALLSRYKFAGFLHTDTSGVLNFDAPYHVFIDEMLPLFILCFSDTKRNENYFFKNIPTSVYSYHYEESRSLVLGTKDTEFFDLWDILLRGRSLDTGGWFFSSDECAGYMTAEEQRLLKGKIQRYFGDSGSIEAMYQSTHVDYTGLQCMCNVLDTIGDKHELLFIIDGY